MFPYISLNIKGKKYVSYPPRQHNTPPGVMVAYYKPPTLVQRGSNKFIINKTQNTLFKQKLSSNALIKYKNLILCSCLGGSMCYFDHIEFP